MFSFFLFACGGTPQVQGTVVDIWNNPISGAEVYMDNGGDPTQSSSSGGFSFDAQEGNLRFRAQKEGYMAGVAQISYKKDVEKPTVEIVLYPLAKENGVWFIDNEVYTNIKQSPLASIEGDGYSLMGIKNIGDAVINKPKPSFIFKTSMTKEQLKQMDLELHELEFQEKRSFNTITGPKDAEIDIWTAKTQKEFTIKELQAKTDDHFLIELNAPLSKGVYAFHSHNTLSNNQEIRKLPKELLIAYPFRVK